MTNTPNIVHICPRCGRPEGEECDRLPGAECLFDDAPQTNALDWQTCLHHISATRIGHELDDGSRARTCSICGAWCGPFNGMPVVYNPPLQGNAA